MQQQISSSRPAQGRWSARRHPDRLPFRAGRARESGCVRRHGAHRQPHDEPGQGGPDHHHGGHRRAAFTGMAGLGAGRSTSPTHQGAGERGHSLRSALADGRRHEHGAGDRDAVARPVRPMRLRLRFQDRELVLDEQRSEHHHRTRRGQRPRDQGQPDLAPACAHRDQPQQVRAHRSEHQRHLRADRGRRGVVCPSRQPADQGRGDDWPRALARAGVAADHSLCLRRS